jgi:hypothetical protein
MVELPIPVQGYILCDVAWFPRGSVKKHIIHVLNDFIYPFLLANIPIII